MRLPRVPLRALTTPTPRRTRPSARRGVILEPMSPPCAHEVPTEPLRDAPGLSRAALDLLVTNHARFLAFLERRVGRRDLAEEILQDAFVRSLSRGGAARLRADESAVAWFYRLLRNAIVDHGRHASAEQRALARAAEEASEPTERERDGELVEVICACVQSLLETLKPEHRRAIQRVELGGTSLRELAAAESITPGHAGVRLFRARQALRRRIEQSCGPCAEHGCHSCECRSEPHPRARPAVTPCPPSDP
jgi:RNA polymerase sigma factor (sigma-70 family)